MELKPIYHSYVNKKTPPLLRFGCRYCFVLGFVLGHVTYPLHKGTETLYEALYEALYMKVHPFCEYHPSCLLSAPIVCLIK